MMMGFDVFGDVSFITESDAAEFVEHLAAGVVAATRCTKCGELAFPPRKTCKSCVTDKVEWFPITSTGHVQAYSDVHFGPSGFENKTPYVLAVVRFPEGVQILAKVDKAISKSEVSIGMELRAATMPLPNHRFTLGFVRPSTYAR